MASFANISIRFTANLKEFSTKMQNAERSAKKAGASFKKIGTNLSLGLTAPIAALGVTSFNTFSDFEDQLAKVKAVSGATAAEFSKLTNLAKSLGAVTRFTASEVGALELNLSKLGFSPDEILKATSSILDLSLAAGEDLATAASVAGGTLRAFGLSADETGRVADVMAKSFSSSALDLQKFSVSMSAVAPVAKSAGQSIETTTGQLAVLVNANIDASTAGTALRNIFLRLTAQGLTLDQAMAKINNSTNKNLTAFKLFGTRGATVATVLAENYTESKKFGVAFESAGGSASAMAKIMDNTAKGGIKRLQSAIESAQIAIGDVLAPTISNIVNKISGWISKFQGLEASTKKTIVVISGLVAAIGPLLVVMGFLLTNVLPGLVSAVAFISSSLIPGFISAIAAARISMLSFSAAIAANPIGAILTVISLAAASFLLFKDSTEKATEAQDGFISISKEVTNSIAAEKAKLSELLFIARDEQVSKKQRLKAIREINKISPKYLSDLTLEKINTDSARIAIDKYNESLIQLARAKVVQGRLISIQDKIVSTELRGSRARKKAAESERLALVFRDRALRNNTSEFVERQKYIKAFTDVNNAYIDTLKKEEQALLNLIKTGDELNNINNDNGPIEPIIPGAGRTKINISDFEADGSAYFGDQNEQLLERISLLEAMRSGFSKTSAEYGKLTQEILFHQETLANAAAGLVADLEFPIKTDSFDNYQQKLQQLRQTSEAVGSAVSGVFRNFSTSIIDSLGLAKDGFEGFVKGLAETILQLIAQLLAASISQSIAGATASGTATGPAAILTTPGFIASAVGGVLAAFAAIPKFADGGIVSGPTLGLMGEYSGARNNPEVIAPLNKLKNLIGDTGGSVVLNGGFVVRGDQLQLVLDRNTQKNSRI